MAHSQTVVWHDFTNTKLRTNRFIDIYMPTGICGIATIAFFVLGLTQGITNINEVERIELIIERITFKDGVRQSPHYDLTATNYSNNFRVPADYTGIFNVTDLKYRMNENRKFHAWIKKDDMSELNSSETLMIYSICEQNKCFLNLNEVMEETKSSRGIGTPVGGIIMGIITVIVFVARVRKYG